MKNVLVSSSFPEKIFLFLKCEGVQLPKKGTFWVTAQGSQNQPALGQGEGLLKKVLYGGAPPRGPTLYLGIYLFWKKRYPLRITSIDKWYPFHIPSSKFGIPFNCFKCTVLKIFINHTSRTFSGLYQRWNTSVSPLEPFYQTKWHISQPFHTLQLEISRLPFRYLKPEKSKPFREEHRRIGRYMEYPPLPPWEFACARISDSRDITR